MISVFVAAGAATVILIARQVLKDEAVVAPVRRSLVDVEIEWKCPAGHMFRAGGQIEPRKCWTCDQLAYPVTRFHCNTHGSVDVFARFEPGPDGRPALAAYRLQSADWTPAVDGVVCPRCKQPMTRVTEDPLAKAKQKKP